MGKNVPFYPGWVADVRSMLEVVGERGHIARARCRKCGKVQDLDRDALNRIAKAKGLAYSLIDKRTRCRLTTGCTGWNIFAYQRGCWFYGLYSDAQERLWEVSDEARDRLTREEMLQALRDSKHDRDNKKARERH
jgi:predicted DNA binding protein